MSLVKLTYTVSSSFKERSPNLETGDGCKATAPDRALTWCILKNNLWQAQRPVPLLEEAGGEEAPYCSKFIARNTDLEHFVLFCYICVTPVHSRIAHRKRNGI